MTLYVATVGNDPAPVALGYLAACEQTAFQEARLFLDKPRGPFEEARQQALLRWLEGHGLTVKANEPFGADEAQGAIFNLTGGQKPSVLPLLQRAQSTASSAFVVDAHGQELLIHNLLAAASEPATRHLGVQDYLQLYLPPEVQQQALMRVHGLKVLPSALALALGLPKNTGAAECWVKPPAHAIYPGRTAWGNSHIVMWWVVRRSQLFLVWDIRQLPSEKLRERLRWLGKKTRDLGGQLATPLFWMSAVSSELVEWIEQDLQAQVILAGGQPPLHGTLPEPSPDISSLEPAPKVKGEGTDSAPGNVYVALLGGQPIPPLVGLQSHPNVSQVYLLCTPQVHLTGQRLKTVLEHRPEWQGRVHILPVEAAQPVSIRQQLSKIHQHHPQAVISINLSGGTRALALHAELWAQNLPFAQTEYTLGHQVQRQAEHFTAQWHLTLPKHLISCLSSNTPSYSC